MHSTQANEHTFTIPGEHVTTFFLEMTQLYIWHLHDEGPEGTTCR